MGSFHDMGEQTKRAADLASFVLAGVAAITLNQVAVAVTVASGLMSMVWLGLRIFDRLKYGPGRGND